jgi:putative ABC transport system permease protein
MREMGIRIALGAQRHDVARLIFAHVGRITVIGGTVGAALALALGRVGRSVLFGLDGSSPAIVGGAVILVVAVAFTAGFAPARRASLVNPVEALKAE